MNKQRLTLALSAALTLAVAIPLYAATVVAPGTSEDSVNKSLTVADGTSVKDVDTVNGNIDIGNKAVAAEVSTVNGSIEVGDDVSVDSLETVNGSIESGSNLRTRHNVETVNGSIELGAGSGVEGSVSTVNGPISLRNVSVTENVETVNGALDLSAARIGGNVELVNGRLDLQDASVVAGEIRVRKPQNSGWGWGNKRKPPIVIIGEGSEVRGKILIENEETKLYVHQNARVGAIEGATAQRYSGSAPE
jgi:DUF4097 and DUF4098 domain-containing protein YvlB